MSTKALACFVKTPGVTPAKTRLAQGCGAAVAERFYNLSIECIRQLFKSAESRDLKASCFWAVAEPLDEVKAFWGDDRLITQGYGTLADRLDRVYSGLKKDFDLVTLIGVDCPQLAWQHIDDSWQRATSQVILGPAADGGFYLLSASQRLPTDLWQAVQYSHAKTRTQLTNKLTDLGLNFDDEYLPMLHDVDIREDIGPVIIELQDLSTRQSAQEVLLTFLNSLKFGE